MNLFKFFPLKIILLFLAFNAVGQEKIVSVTKLMGMTSENGGSIFSIHESGGDIKVRKSLAVTGKPYDCGLTESNNKVWGMTPIGGEYGYGVIFRMNTDGSNFSIVHDFDGINGSGPRGSLTEINGKLWGITAQGGKNKVGTIFSIGRDGNSFTKVYDFDTATGSFPTGYLLESNGRIWGVTLHGGADEYSTGVLFSINLDGSDFAVSHDFGGRMGAHPSGGLIESHGRIWGLTATGGNVDGIIFSINREGNDFTVAHNFEGENGKSPEGSLIEYEGRLWGVTYSGGLENYGTLFSIGTDGTNFRKEHDFTSSVVGSPNSSLVVNDGKVWGTTSSGGALFSFNSDGTFVQHHEYIYESGHTPQGGLSVIGGKFWGMTYGGGFDGFGVIYNTDLDGENYSAIHHFGTVQPHTPHGDLIEHQGRLWGMTSKGGINRQGAIFSMDIDGSDFETIHSFNIVGGDTPKGSLLLSNGKFWGMTESDGEYDRGVIFSIETDGSNFLTVHQFDGTNGKVPQGSLIESGGKLWGMTSEGGANGDGVIFSINTNGTGYTNVHDFSEENGKLPFGDLMISNGKFWGMTKEGGEFDYGVIFNLNLNGTGFAKVHDFIGQGEGRTPYGNLIEFNGALWGMTAASKTVVSNGDSGNGVIFRVNLDGINYSVRHSFDDYVEPSDYTGSSPKGSLVVHNDELWGMNSTKVFSFDPNESIMTRVVEINGYPYGSLIVVTSDEVLNVPEEQKSLSVSVFPNPVDDNLTIRSGGQESKALLLSLTGEVVVEMKIQGESVIDVSHTPPGIYILHLINEKNNAMATRKIIKR